MGSPIRVRVLGQVVIEDDASDAALGRGQARELLALLVAHRRNVLRTSEIVTALWEEEPPSTAATIVHGHVRRIRRALGEASVVHDGQGYRLDLPAESVDLWMVDDAVRSGDHRRARALWSEPAFGVYAPRHWVRGVVFLLDHLRGIAAESDWRRRPRRALPVGRLIGRRRELAAVRAARSRSRLVTIVGLGGVGKSRLAQEVVAEFPRALQVDLGAGAGPVASRIADDIGLTATGERTWDTRMIASAVGRHETLVVLDGCEHAHDEAGAVVDELLESCPSLQILATSRMALGNSAEQVVALLPFEKPGDLDGDSVDLLMDRMAELGVPAERVDRRRLAQICASTAGVALAIELAVADATFGWDTAAAPDRGSGTDSGPPSPARPADAVDRAVRHALDRLTPGAAVTVRRAAHLDHGFTPALLAGLAGAEVSAPAVLHELHAIGLVSTRPSRRLGLPDAVRAVVLEPCDAVALGPAAHALSETLAAVRPDLGRPLVESSLDAAVAELPNVVSVSSALTAVARHIDALGMATAAGDAWAEAGQWKRGGALIAGLLDQTRPDGTDPGADADVAFGAHALPVEPLLWAGAVRAMAVASATYAVIREIGDRVSAATSIARTYGAEPLEAHLCFYEALGAGYGGDLDAAGRRRDRLRALATLLDNDYVGIMADHIEALSLLVSGDASGSADRLESNAMRLEHMDALSDAARALRTAALAWRTDGSTDAAYRKLKDAEALAIEGRSLGTLATIRSDIVEVRHRRGDLDRQDVVDALDAVLGVGNLRAAGLLGIRLGTIDRDPAVLADATLDLLESDRAWSAVALAELVGVLPRRHRMQAVAPLVAARLRDDWGSPLGAEESLIVDRLCASATGDPSETAVDADLEDLLREIVHDRAST